MAFHEVRFPTAIAFGSSGGPTRRTIISKSGSGFENRNSQWDSSRRKYEAGYGVKSLSDIHTVLEFFEERRGMLHGFRWKDKTDFKSCAPDKAPTNVDQVMKQLDHRRFQLQKTYGSVYDPYVREIRKPVIDTVIVGHPTAQVNVSTYMVDHTTGIITFDHDWAMDSGLTAGFEFDVPVRFNTDEFMVDLTGFNAGDVPDIPIIELRV